MMSSNNLKHSAQLLIVCITVVIGLVGRAKATSECRSLVRQYFECQQLKMTKMTDFLAPNAYYYVPSLEVEDNILTDEFYQTSGIGNMRFGEALAFIKSIYRQVDTSCNTEFCDCVRNRMLGSSYWERNYSSIFLQQNRLDQMQPILLSFNEKYQEDMLSYKDISSWLFYSSARNNLSTLNQFCIDYEYTYYRVYFYDNDLDSCIDYSNYYVRKTK